MQLRPVLQLLRSLSTLRLLLWLLRLPTGGGLLRLSPSTPPVTDTGRSPSLLVAGGFPFSGGWWKRYGEGGDALHLLGTGRPNSPRPRGRPRARYCHGGVLLDAREGANRRGGGPRWSDSGRSPRRCSWLLVVLGQRRDSITTRTSAKADRDVAGEEIGLPQEELAVVAVVKTMVTEEDVGTLRAEGPDP